MAIRTATVYFADGDIVKYTGEGVEMRALNNDLIVIKTDPYEAYYFSFGTWRFADLREGAAQNDSEGQPIGPDEDGSAESVAPSITEPGDGVVITVAVPGD